MSSSRLQKYTKICLWETISSQKPPRAPPVNTSFRSIQIHFAQTHRSSVYYYYFGGVAVANDLSAEFIKNE